jgi:hypothetical protein
LIGAWFEVTFVTVAAQGVRQDDGARTGGSTMREGMVGVTSATVEVLR